MKILLTVGHSKLKNGNYTSADGTKNGGGNEYIFCKSLSKYLEKELLARKHKVNRVVCPEGVFTKPTQERQYKIKIENATKYDLTIELHLNASENANVEGCEVLYKTRNGKKYADKIQKKLATLFKDRGTKQRSDLYMLNQTKSPAVLIEIFFCTNKKEWNYAVANKEKIAKLIAKAL